MSRRAALQQLTTCLQGRLPAHADWMAILDLANRSLVTAELCTAVATSSEFSALPKDVQTFLLEVRSRNRERNRRLAVQLRDALAALNGAGIEPVLLKGAALWTGRPGDESDRILADIDLLVRGPEVARAIAALQAAGFGLTSRYPGNDVHVVAELARPSDVGLIDLHQRPPGPPGLAQIDNLAAYCTPVILDGLRAMRPASAVQIFFLVLHDQFHDGDYWRGSFDLRHLMDIARLSTAPEGVDWKFLESLCRTPLVRNALETQLIAAERFARASRPPSSHGAVVDAGPTPQTFVAVCPPQTLSSSCRRRGGQRVLQSFGASGGKQGRAPPGIGTCEQQGLGIRSSEAISAHPLPSTGQALACRLPHAFAVWRR